MRYAIISDIHSNLQALYSAYDIIAKRKIDEIICLGDVVGYNAYPLESLRFLRANPKLKFVVAGNHDELSTRELGFSNVLSVTKVALEGIKYSASKLDKEARQWLYSLPKFVKVENKDIPFTVTHGIGSNQGYVLMESDAREAMDVLQQHYKTNLGFFGHSHFPSVIKRDKFGFTVFDIYDKSGAFLRRYGNIFSISSAFDGSECFLINPGAVGQPRGKSKTSFAIFDTSQKTVEFVFFDYDKTKAQDAIIKSGLSEELAKKLNG